MSELELSNIVIEGLKSLNTVISSDLTKKIISNAVKMTLHSDASKTIELIIDNVVGLIDSIGSMLYSFVRKEY